MRRTASGPTGHEANHDESRTDWQQKKEHILASISALYALSRNGLWGLLLFLAASALALYYQDYSLTGSLPAEIREMLGAAPPVVLVDALLAVSTLSSLIIIAGRVHDWRPPGNTWGHLGFRLMFYGLYFITDAMTEHVYAVFISGLAVLTLQHYHVWNYTARAIERQRELLGAFAGMGQEGLWNVKGRL